MSVISGEENIHPVHVTLHDVIRTIWNDPAGISPEFRQNYYLQHILNDWNGLERFEAILLDAIANVQHPLNCHRCEQIVDETRTLKSFRRT